ncbi:hypothetical protein, partial [Pseudoalteromonas sp. SG41-6]|nr:hypothetical protein [Pseudoalteromonas sp. SG41-6]
MDNTRNKLTMLANRYKRLLSKKYNHICLTNGCNEQAILSHSISKSTLKKISEDQHVISPIFNLGVNKSYMSNAIVSEKNVGFKKIGINKASAYKVFCSKCDNSIFANLDNNGILSYRELFLQLYRSVCTKKFQ